MGKISLGRAAANSSEQLPRILENLTKRRLGHLARKWLKDYTTVETIQDHVILEQLLNTQPKDMGIFARERKPKSSLEASMLANDYLQARKAYLLNHKTPLKE